APAVPKGMVEGVALGRFVGQEARNVAIAEGKTTRGKIEFIGREFAQHAVTLSLFEQCSLELDRAEVLKDVRNRDAAPVAVAIVNTATDAVDFIDPQFADTGAIRRAYGRVRTCPHHCSLVIRQLRL